MNYNGIFDNHLYDRNFFDNELYLALPEIENPQTKFNEFAKILENIKPGDAEANLDLSFTARILAALGWPFAYQQKFKFHGSKKIPDFLIFRDAEDRNFFLEAPGDKKPLDRIFSIWEDKAENVRLDNGRTDTANPYFQLMEYLNLLRLPFGFLSNGHEIWYIDNSQIFAEKRYLGVNLARLVESGDVKGLAIFMGIFGRYGHISAAPEKAVPISLLEQEGKKYVEQSEEDLRNAIYGLNGRDSFFEKCGTFLYNAQSVKDESILPELYKNCLYFTFRLMFIAFFEDRHQNILQKHSGYQSVSLAYIYKKAKELVSAGNEKGYEIWNSLQNLFRALDEGNPNLDIPLFNGGLFSPHIAKMLVRPKMMNNAQCLELLDMLYGETETGVIRDFSSLSVIQLGRIYESLLEYEFRIAEENLWYMEYRQRQNGKLVSVDGYYDTEDYFNIKSQKNCEIIGKAAEYKKGQLYLAGGRNSRKQSASYYTPKSLSRPLVTAALDDAVAKLDEHESILDLKILDNACGSGHLLVEALQYFTKLALERLDRDQALKTVLQNEKRRIDDALNQMGLSRLGIKVDELSVLKRILLKKTIYGVDIQPFAVELARLALWLETFVFGTPLSFIEHHIKAGNSLLGCSMARVRKNFLAPGQVNIFDNDITNSFRALDSVFQKLSGLQDTTAADIIQSKAIYAKEIKPLLEEISQCFDLLNAGDLLEAESFADGKMAALKTPGGDPKPEAWKKRMTISSQEKKKTGRSFISNYEKIAQELHDRRENWREIAEIILQLGKRYGFFNWEMEFPEVFGDPVNPGFHVIIGNPPWDKTKFSDPDFFSQYRSNYRQLSNAAKRQVMTGLFAKPFIKERYEKQYADILAINEYYKERFPLSRGAGDGNLFRFFVENNLRLLRRNGTLNYVIPTALWTDDGSTELRRHILDKYRLTSFYGFENREKLFPDIDMRYKFGLMSVERPKKGDSGKWHGADAAFMLTDPSDLNDKGANFVYGPEDIEITSPHWHALMEMGGRAELDIMRKIHSRAYAFLDPGWLDFRRELDATNDKKIFHENWREGMIPLYKGACVWQFDSEYWNDAGDDNRNEYWLDPMEMDAYLLAKERGRLIDDIYDQLPQKGKMSKTKAVLKALDLKRESDLDAFIVPDRTYPRLAFRAIARDTDERTMIAAILPANVGAQNSLWISIPKRYVQKGRNVEAEAVSPQRLFFAQAVFNSLVFDWVMRSSIAMNVNKTYIGRMPMAQPDDGEIMSNAAFRKLAQNSLLLSVFYNEKAFSGFFTAFGMEEGDKIRSKKAADIIRRENDAIIASLYGLDQRDMEIMLSSFTVMNRKSSGYGKALLEMMED